MNSDILLTVCFNARYFVFLTVHFLYLNVCFTLILNELMENTVVYIFGEDSKAGVMAQIMYTEDINKG